MRKQTRFMTIVIVIVLLLDPIVIAPSSKIHKSVQTLPNFPIVQNNPNNDGARQTHTDEKQAGNYNPSSTHMEVEKVTELLDSSAQNVFIVDDIAFIASGCGGLQLVNIANPDAPAFVGSYDDGGDINDVHVEGDYAYIIDNLEGLKIINIAVPSAPFKVAQFHDESFISTILYAPQKILVKDDFAYITEYYNGWKIINVSDPLNPYLLCHHGQSELHPVLDIKVHENIIYIAKKGMIERVYKSVNNGVLTLTPQFSINCEKPENIFVDFPYLYVLETKNGDWKIYDLYTISSETAIPIHTTPKFYGYTHIFVENDVAYVRNNTDILFFDVSNPYSPSEIGNYTVDLEWSYTTSYVFRVHEDMLYLGCGLYGLHLLDVSSILSPTMRGSYDEGRRIYNMVIHDSVGYFAYDSKGYAIFDLNNPDEPSVLYQNNTVGCTKIDVKDSYAYMSTHIRINSSHVQQNFTILDISDPSNPLELSSIILNNKYTFVGGILVEEDYAYINYLDDFLIFDISSPSTPYMIGCVNGTNKPFYSRSLYKRDNYIFTGGQDKFSIVNVSAKDSPECIFSCSVSSEWHSLNLAIKGTYAYVTGMGLYIFDISDLTDVQIVKTLESDHFVFEAFIEGNHLFVGMDDKFIVYDLTNPAHPTSVMEAASATINDFYCYDSHLYCGFYLDNGLSIFHAQPDSSGPSFTSPSHSPIHPTNMDLINIRVNVTDLSGIQSVTLHYQVVDGYEQDQDMNHLVEDMYEAVIGPFAANTSVRYRISARDASNSNNEATDNNSSSYYWISIQEDTEQPQITDITFEPVAPTSTDEITIQADVSDISGIASVTLRYRIDAGGWLDEEMVKVGNSSIYSIKRGPYIDGTVIEFSIVASDASPTANEALDTNEGALYKITIGETEKSGFDLLDLSFIVTSLIFMQLCVSIRKKRRTIKT